MHDDIASAFQTTRYRVFLNGAPQDVHIAAPCPEALARWIRQYDGRRAAWLITAYNPQARALDEARNHARDRWLRHWVACRARASLDAVNQALDGGWPDEPGVLMAGVAEDEVRALARRLGQLAIVAVPANGPAVLVWIEGQSAC